MIPDGPELTGRWTRREEPEWGPLLRAVGENLTGDFMWMYEVETSEGSFHAYKHIDTRRYVHIDADLNAYAYLDKERYRRVPIWLVLEEALRDAERIRAAYHDDEEWPPIWHDGPTLAPMRFVHVNVRVRDIDASLRFYEALGFERRGRLQFEGAYNVYLGLPGDGDTLELTVNEDRDEPYDLGSGYGHLALTVEDLDDLLERLAERDIEPEKPPYHPGGRTEYRICFVADPDGYRIELIDGDFATPQDPEP